MSDLLKAPIDWCWNGNTYKVFPTDVMIEGMFSDWVVREAAIALERLQEHVSVEFYETQLRIFNARLVGKQYRWGSEEVMNAISSDEGLKQLAWLKIARGQGKGGAVLQREQVDTIFQDKAKWKELLDILYQQDFPDFFERRKAREAKANAGLQAVPP